MRTTCLLVVPVLALALAGCSDTQEAVNSVSATVGKLTDCAGLARDVASAGINRVPTQAQADAAQRKLKDRVATIGDARVKDAAGELADKVGGLADAIRSSDRAAISAKVSEVRAAVASAARACNLPMEQFVPQSR